MTIDRDGRINMLRDAAEGDLVAHVWRSDRFPGADMVIRYTMPYAEVDPDNHGLPTNFATEVGLIYAGPLSLNQAAKKLLSMRVASQAIES